MSIGEGQVGMVINIVSVVQSAGSGVPSSQISTTTVSTPENPGSGVYVNVPSPLIVIVPLLASSTGVVLTTRLPSMSKSPVSVKSPLTGVFTEVVKFSLSTTGGSFTGFTVTNNVSFTHSTGSGVPLSHTVYTTVSIPLKSGAGV